MPRAKGNNNNKLFLHPNNCVSPCKDCPDRTYDCHFKGKCKNPQMTYDEYKKNLNETRLDREHGLHGNHGRFREGLESEVKQYE